MSYLSYYNMFSDFNAGAGVSDMELFTKEEEESFLPRPDESGEYKLNFPNLKGSFPDILMRNDIQSLIGLILFVLAITTTPVIAIIMIAVASALLPFPSLVIAYCLSMQILNFGSNGGNRTIAMSIICVGLAILTMVMNSVSKTAYTISYIILAVLFCIYAFNLTKFSKINTSTINKCTREFRGGNKYGIEKPSFYED
ncbi:IMV membrane protein [Deerpox virus W-1170-84]|uniref:IMV membrane protein n=1 Tax=Deerpox virus (strain W-1170-84) TaxID=305676 RepID=Q08F64_DPV84|nr:IMV membrane protein [Deerpox virus W-1170-84]